jgi:hypothetical protein
VDSRLATAVKEVKVHGEITGEPHRAVVLTLGSEAVCALIRAVTKPKAFPRERPVGCPRRPVLPAVSDASWTAGALDGSAGGEEALASRWGSVAECIEAELCRQCDLVDADGLPLREYTGRGGGLQVKWKRVLPPRIVGQHGLSDAQLHRLMWVLNRTEELVHLARLRRGGPLRAKQLEQWHRIVHNLNRPRGQLDQMAAKDGD